jgi:PPOX class probable FMN-dependent enzyme
MAPRDRGGQYPQAGRLSGAVLQTEGHFMLRFDEVIDTPQRLHALTRQPTERARNKTIDHIDDICRRFIAASPFAIVASRGADGRLDVSPKGDPAGFVQVLDEKTLAIPDRPGNHRLDTFLNVLAHPEVGLIFLIPGNGDTLRVAGHAALVRDRTLQARLAAGGKEPELILIVTVEQAFMHCSKCITRSRLWSPDHWPDRVTVPTLAEAIMAHARPAESAADVRAFIEEHNTRLY